MAICTRYTWHYMPQTADKPNTLRSNFFAITVASVLLLGFAAGGLWTAGQVALAPSTVPAYLAVKDNTDNSSLSSSTHAPQLRISPSGPIWREITEAQRQVLMPLRERWDTIGALAKRRWLVLADRYPTMDETERTKLVSRMHTWASLSAQQRNQARLNFESARRLSAQELQKKWDEYQALSAAEKNRLAEQARTKARIAKKAKRRLAAPPQEPESETLPVVTQPVATPKASPSIHIAPLPPSAAHTEVLSQPITIPQSMPSVELPPLPVTPDVNQAGNTTPSTPKHAQ